MAERPILFSAPMVRAILSGAKTQTRRLVDPRGFAGTWLRHLDRGDSERAACAYVCDPENYPPFVVGDRLWVRETWAYFGGDEYLYQREPDHVVYGADRDTDHRLVRFAGVPGGRWRPSVHMPRWASRITLEITDVRVQRLQDISEEDARAEGVTGAPFCKAGRPNGMEHVEAFEGFWHRINGKRCPWASNPWVWALSFKRVEQRGEKAVANG